MEGNSFKSALTLLLSRKFNETYIRYWDASQNNLFRKQVYNDETARVQEHKNNNDNMIMIT